MPVAPLFYLPILRYLIEGVTKNDIFFIQKWNTHVSSQKISDEQCFVVLRLFLVSLIADLYCAGCECSDCCVCA